MQKIRDGERAQVVLPGHLKQRAMKVAEVQSELTGRRVTLSSMIRSALAGEVVARERDLDHEFGGPDWRWDGEKPPGHLTG